MFESIRDKFHSFQENLSTTLKGLSVSDSLSQEESSNENIPVNLNAGTDLLIKFQSSWSELHKASQINANKAEEADQLIQKTHKRVDKQWRDVGQLAYLLTSLPVVILSMDELTAKIKHLEGLFGAVEKALVELEDILDTRDFQNRQLEQRFQLALYEEKKLAGLESFRIKLAEELAEKVRRHEVRQQRLLREHQLASEENFKEDMKIYKETHAVPRIEFAKTGSSDEPQNSSLEDIVLDTGDSSALDEFLNESKDSGNEVKE